MMNKMDPILKSRIKYMIIIYLVFFLLAVFVVPAESSSLYPQIQKQDLINNSNHDKTASFLAILVRNLVVGLTIISIGLLGYEIFPSILLAWNAFTIGGAIAMFQAKGMLVITLSILPHAIIELPMSIFAASIGCTLAYKMYTDGYDIISLYHYRGDHQPIKNNIRKYLLKPYLLYIVPLIVIAAFIEAFISLEILKIILVSV